jgi:ABC-type multidrug transport system fused ATPase/permease subunit
LKILKEASIDGIKENGLVQHAVQKKVPSCYALKTEGLSFNYNDRQETHHSVFHNLNIELPERQMLVIKGPSGSGKTTLLMVLIGVLSHSSGRVEWGGVNMAELDTSAFRSKIGYMGPEPYIISGTVRDNLLYGMREKFTDEELWRACREANAEPFLNAMKNGLDSRLNEQGEGLSMGQKQRLGLARELLGKTWLLVLDEVTSNLDPVTEKVIIRNVDAMKTGMTILVSTHSNAFDGITNQILDLGDSSISETVS